jgi:hypothetical protein
MYLLGVLEKVLAGVDMRVPMSVFEPTRKPIHGQSSRALFLRTPGAAFGYDLSMWLLSDIAPGADT